MDLKPKGKDVINLSEEKKEEDMNMVAEIEDENQVSQSKLKSNEKEQKKETDKENKHLEKEILKEEKLIEDTKENKDKKQNEEEKSKNEPIVNSQEFTLSNETKGLFLQKVTKLTNIFTFTDKYSSLLVQIYKHFAEPLFLRISNTMANDLKPYMKFIKEISIASGIYSSELKKASTVIRPNPTDESHLIGKNMQSIVNNIQENIMETMASFSSTMKTNLITNPQYVKYDATYSKLESHYKNLLKIIQKINHRQDKKNTFYKKKFENIFETYKNKFNDSNLPNELIEMTDFIIIEQQLINIVNKTFIKTHHFLDESLIDIKAMQDILLETIKLLKETFESYLEINKKLLKESIITSVGSIDLFNQDILENKIKEKLSISEILNDNPQMLKEFNECLSLFQNIFMQSSLIKVDKIYEDNLFKIETYKTIQDFIEFLITLNPKACEINYSNIIEYQCSLKRDPGVFKAWKTTHVVITKQNHVILFDDEINDTNFSVFNLKTFTIKPKKDKSKAFCFEVIFIPKGKVIVFDALTEDTFKGVTKALGMEEVVKEIKEENNQSEEVKKEENKEIKV